MSPSHPVARRLRLALTWVGVLVGSLALAATGAPKTSFDVAGGDAAETLRQLARQARESVVFPIDRVRGIQTLPVRGEYTTREAAARMVAGSELFVSQDLPTGALTISRGPNPESTTPKSPPSQSVKKSFPSRLTAALAIFSTSLLAQSVVPAPATTSAALDETVVLSPFEIRASSDVGYQARETIAGGRLRTDLKDVSAQVDVMTQEFLSDLGINTLEDSFKYSLSVESEGDWYDPAGTGTLTLNPFNPSTGNRARGLARASTSVGFFETSASVDSYNTERYSFVNGPNAILFGNGMAGGSVDTSFKRAGTNRNKYSVSLQVDSDQGYRASIDLNQVLIKDRLAVRYTTMSQDQDYGRTPSYDRQKRSFGTISFEPFKTLRLRAYYDYGDIQRLPVRATLVQDKVTPYLNTLSPEVRARFLATYDPSVLRGFDNSALNSFNNTANNNAADAALTGQGFRTLTNGLANTEIATRLSLPTQPVLVSGSLTTSPIPIMLWHNTAVTSNGPGPFFGENSDWSFTDDSIYPSTLNLFGNGLRNATRSRIYGGVIEFNPARNLFIEYGFNRESVNHAYTETLGQGNAELLLDLNRYLPVTVASGPTPPASARVLNPNFGRYYVQSGVTGGDNQNEREDHRVTATYTFDFTQKKGWARWLGVHRLLGLWTSQMSQRFAQILNGGTGATVISDNDFTVTTSGTTTTPLPSAAVSAFENARRLQVRHYLGSPTARSGGAPFVDLKVDPWNWGEVGRDASGRPVVVAGENLPWGSAFPVGNGRKETKGTMLSLQSAFLNNRIIASYGRRSDENTYKNWIGNSSQPRYDASTGQFVIPTAPVSSTNLAHLQNAPYMNWKDFKKLGLARIQSQGGQEENPESVLKGLVVHPLSWFSLFYNESTSAYAAEFTRTNLDGTPMTIDDGVGKDYGFAVSLPNGKLSVRVNWFESTRVGGNSTFQANSGPGQGSLRDSLYHAEKTFLNVNPNFNFTGNTYEYYLGRTRETNPAYNATTRFVPGSVPAAPNRESSGIQADRRAEGLEISLTASPLPGLSFALRAAENTTADSNAGIIWFEYATARWKDWESIAAVPLHNIEGQPTNIQTYFQTVILPSMAYVMNSNGMPNPQERKHRANLTARYAFQGDTPLKGFFVGGNYNWRSKSILGFFTRVAETKDVYKPFNGVGAGGFLVPDFNNPINGTALVSIDAFFGYRRKFNKGKYEWSAQVNIRNLLDDREFIPQRVYSKTTAGVNEFRYTNYNVPDPRRFIFTNTISF